MALRRRLAALARRSRRPPAAEGPEGWADTAPSPWDQPTRAEARATAWCNICRWTGDHFVDPDHCEFTLCPRCGASARDRFLHWCLVRRTPPSLRARLLETSPRMGRDDRSAMERWFTYLASDFDERAHAGTVRIDLQAIDLPDGTLDLILSAHVLEHVPDTMQALSELRRVLRPGGRLYLQVPVQQPTTAPPTSPEFHGDNTPVFWRFGTDLTDQLRASGFEVALLSTRTYRDVAASDLTMWPGWSGGVPEGFDFDVVGLITEIDATALTPVIDPEEARRLGIFHDFMFLTWEAIRP